MFHKLFSSTEDCSLGALYSAMRDNDYEKVNALLQAGLKLKNENDDFRIPPLHFACKKPDIDIRIIQALLKAYVDINYSKEKKCLPPLQYACQNHRADIVALLIENGVNLSNLKFNPFLEVIEHYHWQCNDSSICTKCAKLHKTLTTLMSHGLDVNVIMKGKKVSFFHLAIRGYPGLIRTLLPYANTRVCDTEGNGVFVYAFEAVEDYRMDMVTLFTDLGLNPNAENNEGKSARSILIEKIGKLKLHDQQSELLLMEAILAHFDNIKSGKLDESVRNELQHSWQSRWVLKLNPYLLTHKTLVGEGRTGCVYSAKYRASNFIVAVKEVDRDTARKSSASSNEKDILKRIETERMNDPKNADVIIKYYGSCIISREQEALIFSFAPHGRLHNWMYSKENDGDYQVLTGFMQQLAAGVAFLHKHSILHRDLKPKNIVLQTKDNPVIVDFGFALDIGPGDNEDGKIWHWAGTVYYSAPEIMGEESQYKFSSDIFALGITFGEMLSKKAFRESYSEKEFCRKMEDENFRPGLPKACPKEISVLVARTWAHDPKARISAKELAEEFATLQKTM